MNKLESCHYCEYFRVKDYSCLLCGVICLNPFEEVLECCPLREEKYERKRAMFINYKKEYFELMRKYNELERRYEKVKEMKPFTLKLTFRDSSQPTVKIEDATGWGFMQAGIYVQTKGNLKSYYENVLSVEAKQEHQDD